MIGEKFKQHRIELGLSQKDLAESFGVSCHAVREWESSEVVTGLVECALVGAITLLEVSDQAAADAA